MTTTNYGTGHEIGAEKSVPVAITLRTILLSIIVMSAAMTPGNVITFTSITLPQIRPSQDEASWFMSLPTLMAPIGTLFNALTLDAYGSRFNILFAMIPNTVGWFLLANKEASMPLLYVGRLLTGFGLGVCLLPCVIYVAESITANNVHMRSMIGTWVVFSNVIGGLLMYLLSLTLTYDQVAFVFAILSAVSVILILIFIPESPAWLRGKGRVGDAEIAQQRLGIKQPSILHAREVSSSTEKDDSNVGVKSELDSYSLKNVMQYLSQIRRPEVYKPTMITIAFNCFRDFCGVYTILSSMVDLITVYPLKSSPYVLSLVAQVVQIIGCSLLTILTPRFGVRIMAISSFLGTCVGQLGLGLSMIFENPSSSNIFNYIHILSVWEIMFASQIGMLAVPYSVSGEIFPTGAKGFATLALFADALFNFANLKIFPYVYPRYKNVVFFVFGVIGAMGAVLVRAVLPETVGKTMEEINQSYRVESDRKLSDQKDIEDG